MPSKAGKTHAEALRESRLALLAAGADLVLEEAQRNPFAALRVRAVCERAGYSMGAFYNHWATAAKYHDALATFLLSEDDMVLAADFARLDEVVDAHKTLPMREALQRVAEADLDILLANAYWDAVALITVTWGRSRFRDVAARGYRDLDDLTAATYGAVLDQQERQPRPPITTMSEIGVVLQALIDGIANRYRTDPEAVVPPEGKDGVNLYAVAVAAILAVLTRHPGDTTTVDEVLDGLLTYRGESEDPHDHRP